MASERAANCAARAAGTIDRSAANAIDDFRRDLEYWHMALALYVLLQIGVALLALLMIDTLREPRATTAPFAIGDRSFASDGVSEATNRSDARQARPGAAESLLNPSPYER